MSTLTLINPPMLILRQDPMTTGIVYMPVGMAVLAGQVRHAGHTVHCIDAFGESPKSTAITGKFLRRGLESAQCAASITSDTDAVAVYALNLLNHEATIAVVRAVRKRFPRMPLAVVENSQAVTAYSLSEVSSAFIEAGADILLIGESDCTLVRWLDAPRSNLPVKDCQLLDASGQDIPELETLPFPAWDMLPLQSYWQVGHAHGPLTSGRYLPLLSSRGCPYHCRFCVIPALNHGRWRARPAEAVVDEMLWARNTFHVHEFHWEDINPTVDDKRTRAICEGLIRRHANVIWKTVSGTKVESIRDEETVRLMADAGCRYLSISPETGSPKVLQLMGKPFDLDHAVRIARAAKRFGIFMQCCFVLGFPGEEDYDRELTTELVERLIRLGVDEIALFIMTPTPGAAQYKSPEANVSLSELNFSPTWRSDYAVLSSFRANLYRRFVIRKTISHPLAVARQVFHFVERRFETKMEMAPWRALCHTALALRARPGNI